MKGIGIGPAGGRALSRMPGTKVTLAGRTAFLPNDGVRGQVTDTSCEDVRGAF